MRMFVTVSYQQGKNQEEIEDLCRVVKHAGFEDFCFVRDVEAYGHVFDNPRDLMNRARQEIATSDVLLFDASEKSTGRAIEMGMAFDQGKKVIVIMKSGTILKDTVEGVTDAVITYDQISDILQPLSALCAAWQGSKN